MSDDLVERVARALEENSYSGKASTLMLARAAIALVLEEAAKVCDPKGDCSEMDAYGKSYAAAIRAMVKEKGGQ